MFPLSDPIRIFGESRGSKSEHLRGDRSFLPRLQLVPFPSVEPGTLQKKKYNEEAENFKKKAEKRLIGWQLENGPREGGSDPWGGYLSQPLTFRLPRESGNAVLERPLGHRVMPVLQRKMWKKGGFFTGKMGPRGPKIAIFGHFLAIFDHF